MNKNKETIVFHIIFIIALVVFIVAAVELAKIGLNYYNGDKEYNNIARTYVKEETESEEAISDTEMIEDEVFRVDFKALKTDNPDTIGWIRFKNINISYPIMQGEDNDYYLYHTFSGAELTAASIFMDYSNTSDFTDQNTFIYGHNMKNKSMFGNLNNYAKEEYYQENPSFWIYTPDYTYRYDIFSCYLAGVGEQENSFQIGFASAEDYQSYIDAVKERSAYDTGVAVDTVDKIVTLMTCNKAGHAYRFLVHAVQAEAIPVE